MINNNNAQKMRVNVEDLQQTRIAKPVIVFFFSTGCGWCEKMKPDWNEFTSKSPINYSEVSSDEISNYTPSPKEEVIRGFPTLRLYNKGKLVKEYDGDRSYKDILRFVKKYVKEEQPKKNNLILVKARKGNKISKKLLNKLRKQRKKSRAQLKSKSLKNSRTQRKPRTKRQGKKTKGKQNRT
jgi:thioredoxin-like negative regulator of GroEL